MCCFGGSAEQGAFSAFCSLGLSSLLTKGALLRCMCTRFFLSLGVGVLLGVGGFNSRLLSLI